MRELLQIGLIVLIGIGHVKLLLDTQPMESDQRDGSVYQTGLAVGVPYFQYGQFVRFMELK